jgi:DNA repair ATPase RecN
VSRTEEPAKIDRMIKDTETRLKTLQTNLEALDSEIKKIAVFERVLVDNIRILKAQRVITMAKEFKKAKDELNRVKTRLTNLRNDREHFNKAFNDVNDFLKAAHAQYDKITQQSENNVIKFRGADGKERNSKKNS